MLHEMNKHTISFYAAEGAILRCRKLKPTKMCRSINGEKSYTYKKFLTVEYTTPKINKRKIVLDFIKNYDSSYSSDSLSRLFMKTYPNVFNTWNSARHYFYQLRKTKNSKTINPQTKVGIVYNMVNKFPNLSVLCIYRYLHKKNPALFSNKNNTTFLIVKARRLRIRDGKAA